MHYGKAFLKYLDTSTFFDASVHETEVASIWLSISSHVTKRRYGQIDESATAVRMRILQSMEISFKEQHLNREMFQTATVHVKYKEFLNWSLLAKCLS